MWLAYFSGPLAWTVHELLSYALVKLACGSGLMLLEFAVSVLCLLAAAAGIYLSYGATPKRAPQTTVEFMYLSALVLNLLFLFAIVMESLPDLVVNPCL
jgi:hypothetical protein